MKKRIFKIRRRYTTVGEYLAAKRIKAELTQRDVANMLGYSSAQFISNFERGIAVPPLSKLKIMVKKYNMDADEVIDLISDADRALMVEALK